MAADDSMISVKRHWHKHRGRRPGTRDTAGLRPSESHGSVSRLTRSDAVMPGPRPSPWFTVTVATVTRRDYVTKDTESESRVSIVLTQ